MESTCFYFFVASACLKPITDASPLAAAIEETVLSADADSTVSSMAQINHIEA